MSQIQPVTNIWKQGLKIHVSFADLQRLQKYEPEIFKLFSKIADGARVETAEYNYRLRGDTNITKKIMVSKTKIKIIITKQ